ncbi:MAG: HAD hydrolase-like protein [Bacteroidota bacterium]
MNGKLLVIFDIDGTLLFSNKEDSRIFGRAFEDCFGFRIGSINWHDYPHVVDTVILQAAFETAGKTLPDQQTIEDFKDYYVAKLEQGRKINPGGFMEVRGSRTLVEHLLNQAEFEVGIATGGFRKPAFVKLRHVGIPTEQLMMNFADDCYTREQIIQGVLDQAAPLQDQISKIIYVGDALWDVRTTRNMNMPFIGIKPPDQVQELLDAGAKHVISHYEDIEGFIDLCYQSEPPHPAGSF